MQHYSSWHTLFSSFADGIGVLCDTEEKALLEEGEKEAQSISVIPMVNWICLTDRCGKLF